MARNEGEVQSTRNNASDFSSRRPRKTKEKFGNERKERRGAKAEQLMLNREICSTADSGNFQGLLSIIQAKNGQMNLVNLSTALHRLTRLSTEEGFNFWDRHDRRILALKDRIRQHLERLLQQKDAEPHARCLSTLAWAYGRLGECNPEVMKMVSELAERWLNFFKSFELSNLLWGFAKLQLGYLDLFRAAQGHVEARTHEFSTRSLSLVSWAFATATPNSCARCLRKCAEAFAATQSFTEEKPVSLANLVWALATSGTHPRQESLNTIGRACAALLRNFKANELSITLWAFTRLGCFHEELFAAAAQRLCEEEGLRREIHAQGIANTLWAMARLSEVCKEETIPMLSHVLACLLPTCRRLLRRLCPIEFSSTLCAVSKLATRTGMLASADTLLLAAADISRRDPRYLRQLSPQSITGLLGTFRDHLKRKQHSQEAILEVPLDEASYSLVRHLEQLHESLDPSLVIEAVPGRLDMMGGAPDATETPTPHTLLASNFGQSSSGAARSTEIVQGPSAIPPGLATDHQAFGAYGGMEPFPFTVPVYGMPPLGSVAPGLEPSPATMGWDTMHSHAAQFGHHYGPQAPDCLQQPPGYSALTSSEARQEQRTPMFAFGHALPEVETHSVASGLAGSMDAHKLIDLPLEVDEAVGGPAFTVMPEFCHVSRTEEQDIVVVFEIGSLEGHNALDVIFHVNEGMKTVDSVTFTVTKDGLYTMKLPPRQGSWELKVCLQGLVGNQIIEPIAFPFQGCWSAALDAEEVSVAPASSEVPAWSSEAVLAVGKGGSDGASTSASNEYSAEAGAAVCEAAR